MNNSRVKRVHSLLDKTGLPDGSTNFLCSHATLEHVRNPKSCIAEMRRLLRKGGVTAHQIDLRDHRNYARPLEFLKDDESLWNWNDSLYYRPADGAVYTNRWRVSHWINEFESQGFEVLEETITERLEDRNVQRAKADFDQDFKRFSDDDLSKIGLFVVARKL